MRRIPLILIALASVAATRPVAPWTPAQLSCPVRQAPAGLIAAVVKPALPGAPDNADLSDATIEQVTALATTCARQNKVGKSRLDNYLELVTLQLTATGMAEELKARGLDPALVGSVMAIGPGRANPDYAEFDDAEATRLRSIMDEIGCVNIFLSEGAGVSDIVAQLEADGTPVEKDPFGHVKLDTVNPGQWFAKRFGKAIGAEKNMVQKSGYFSRSAAANRFDQELIASMTRLAVDSALAGVSGVIGHDVERGGELRAIEFERIAGGKTFDVDEPWFAEMLATIGQPTGTRVR